eukprot:CAMPEP_0183814540 /NCGR_PEP_ID=MMETSP0803_2-20130417/55141_1 /TAXON_ID=195967 /ORGANISM="Crustomastix stigmata, Strain CCMP3273" /LENGTH=1261 /DNA_ID=CAMNT_0026059403 /DNA_START=87 /DNA_END=3869 /DNA_ORIENTATION=-
MDDTAFAGEPEADGPPEDDLKQPYVPLAIAVFASRRPNCTLAASVAVILAIFGAFFGAYAAAGEDFFKFSYDVDLAVRDGTEQNKYAAVKVASQELTSAPGQPAVQLAQSVFGDFEDNTLSMTVQYKTAGDVLSLRNRREMRELELSIVEDPRYKEFCLLDWGMDARRAEEKGLSSNATVRAEGTAEVRELNALARGNGTVPCAPPRSLLWACNPGRGEACEGQASKYEAYPPGLLYCSVNSTGYDPAYGCTPRGMELQHNVTVNGETLDYAEHFIFTYSSADREALELSDSLQQTFHLLGDSFGRSGNRVTRALRSEFRFALPLAGYESQQDRTDEQLEKVKSFIWDQYNSKIGGAGWDGMTITWTGFKQEGAYMESIAPIEVTLVYISALWAWVTMMVSFRSVLLSSMVMLQTSALSLMSGWLLGNFIFDLQYYGVVMIPAELALMGPMRTSAMSFVDAWLQSGALADEISGSVTSRLSYTWQRCLSTSAYSTIPSLLVFMTFCVSSKFPVFTAVGAFTIVKMVCNMGLTFIVLPGVIMLYEKHLAHRRFWMDFVFDKIEDMQENSVTKFKKKQAKKLRKAMGDEEGGPAPEEDAPEEEDEEEVEEHEKGELRGIEEAFANTLAPALIRWKYPIFLIFTCAAVGGCIGGLTLDSHLNFTLWNPVSLFTPGNNFAQFYTEQINSFTMGTHYNEVKLRVVVGLDPEDPLFIKDPNSLSGSTKGMEPRFVEAQRGVFSISPPPLPPPPLPPPPLPPMMPPPPNPNITYNLTNATYPPPLPAPPSLPPSPGPPRSPAADAVVYTYETQWADAYWMLVYDEDTGANSLGCLYELCTKMSIANEAMYLGGPPFLSANCWVHDFAAWVESTAKMQNSTRSRLLAESYSVEWAVYEMLDWEDVKRDRSAFYPLLIDWMRQPVGQVQGLLNGHRWKGQMYFNTIDDPENQWLVEPGGAVTDKSETLLLRPMLRMAYMEVPLTATDKTGLVGLEMRDKWEEWYEANLNQGQCASADVKRRVESVVTTAMPGFPLFEALQVAENQLLEVFLVSHLVLIVGLSAVYFNWRLSVLVALSTWASVMCAALQLLVMGWDFDATTIVALVSIMSFSVDHSSAIAGAYQTAARDVDDKLPPLYQREDRVTMALTYVGVTSFTSLVCLAGAFIIGLFSRIGVVSRASLLLLTATLTTTVMSLFVMPALLAMLGPLGTAGSLNLWGPVDHTEEEEGLLDDGEGGGGGCCGMGGSKKVKPVGFTGKKKKWKKKAPAADA